MPYMIYLIDIIDCVHSRHLRMQRGNAYVFPRGSSADERVTAEHRLPESRTRASPSRERNYPSARIRGVPEQRKYSPPRRASRIRIHITAP